jgi:acyl-CoA thioester hydrolase
VIRLKKQDNYEYQYKRIIQVGDINYGGHLGNDALVKILHEARISMLHSMGFTELDLGDGETGIIMAEIVVNFKAESFMMDNISVFCHVDDISNVSFRMYYKVTDEDKLIALAETEIVTFNYNKKQISDVPSAFLSALKSKL